jgi:hypothetical protein
MDGGLGRKLFFPLHPCPIANQHGWFGIFSSLKLSFLFIPGGNRTTHFGVLMLHNKSL